MALYWSIAVPAQQYNVVAAANDPFSEALVRLIHCAPNRFAGCTGDSIRTTWLLGEDRKLGFAFPGSAAAIVRLRDGGANAYVEFNGYKSNSQAMAALRVLRQKIKNALGKQFYERERTGDYSFHDFSIRDERGYFSSSIELYASASVTPVYLPGPERKGPGKEPKHWYVMLKIHGGIPLYQYFIDKNIVTTTPLLQTTLQTLLQATVNDFDSLFPGNAVRKRKDTLYMNGYIVLMNRRKAHYTASIRFAVDSMNRARQWAWSQQEVQAAVKDDFVYGITSYGDQPAVYFFPAQYRENGPRIELQYEAGQRGQASYIWLHIESGFTHPTKRGLDLSDLE